MTKELKIAKVANSMSYDLIIYTAWKMNITLKSANIKILWNLLGNLYIPAKVLTSPTLVHWK